MNYKSNPQGFTLLEILVAVFIIAIAFTGVLKLYSRLISAHTALNFYDRAPLLADKLMDEWEAGMINQGMAPTPDTPIEGFDGFEFELTDAALDVIAPRSGDSKQTGPILVELICKISYDSGRYQYTSKSIRLIPQ
ncbi:MAG: hypothetical protein CSA29_05800 [Desulfobacterales bacterium]|nr:MAG: hypothetical protein CSA29_05800 [Desulfobacterales bacterium]